MQACPSEVDTSCYAVWLAQRHDAAERRDCCWCALSSPCWEPGQQERTNTLACEAARAINHEHSHKTQSSSALSWRHRFGGQVGRAWPPFRALRTSAHLCIYNEAVICTRRGNLYMVGQGSHGVAEAPAGPWPEPGRPASSRSATRHDARRRRGALLRGGHVRSPDRAHRPGRRRRAARRVRWPVSSGMHAARRPLVSHHESSRRAKQPAATTIPQSRRPDP